MLADLGPDLACPASVLAACPGCGTEAVCEVAAGPAKERVTVVCALCAAFLEQMEGSQPCAQPSYLQAGSVKADGVDASVPGLATGLFAKPGFEEEMLAPTS